MTAGLRIGIDAGALLRPETGIGRYTRELIGALAELGEGDELTLFVNSLREGAGLDVPGTCRVVNPHIPARVLRLLWTRLGLLAVDRLTGPVDVFHTSDWIHPPLRRGASVTTVHDIGALVYPDWYAPAVAALHRRQNERVARKATRVIAISEFTKGAFLDRFGVEEERVVVVPNGVSPEFEPVDAETSRAVADTYGLPSRFLLYVGTREPRKNLPGLIRIFEGVAREDRDVGLALVGLTGGPMERPVQGAERWTADPVQAAREPDRITDRIHELGPLPREHLIALYSAATAFCFPTLYEGFGLPALEAMACGCPVIASATTAIPEVVGDAGLLVDPEDEEGFAAAVLHALSDGAERERLSRAGRARAETFTWEATARGTRGVYEEATAIT